MMGMARPSNWKLACAATASSKVIPVARFKMSIRRGGSPIGFGDLDGVERSAEGGERPIDMRRVCSVRAYEHVQIFGGAGMAVKRHGVTSHHHEVGTRVMELDEEISKVLRELDHVGRPGTERQGI